MTDAAPARRGALAPLRHRSFALLFTGAFVSNIGTWMETVGVGILVTTATGQARWAGVVAAAGFLPGALLGPIGGALADRLPRKRLLMATTTLQMLFAGLLTVLCIGNTPEPWLVSLIVFGAGCCNAIGFPSYQSMLPDLVPAEDLVGAVALSSAQWNLGRVVGPALAGIVIGSGRYSWAFGINTLSFLAVIAVLVVLRLPAPTPVPGQSILRAIAAGVAYVRREPGLRAVVGFMAVNSLLAAPFIALVAPMAIKVHHAGGRGVSVLVAAQGLGAVTVAVAIGPAVHKWSRSRVLLGAVWLLPVALIGYAMAPTLPLAAVMIFFTGGLYMGALSSFTSTAQLRSPAAVRGRVMSLLNVLLGALYPLGSVIQGALADRIGLPATLAGAGVVMLAVLGIVRLRRPGLGAQLEGPVLAELRSG
jgi:MFS family permease